MIEEREVWHSSNLRVLMGVLSRPDPHKVYVVVRHEKPLVLVWPAAGLTSEETVRVRLNQAIKARNAFAGNEVIMPLHPKQFTKTELRRTASDFYLYIAVNRTPGLITHYDRPIAIFVPLYGMRDVDVWTETMNKVLG